MSADPAVPEAKANPRRAAAGRRQQPADGSGQVRNLNGVADRPGGVSPYSDDTITLGIRSPPGAPNAGSSGQGGDCSSSSRRWTIRATRYRSERHGRVAGRRHSSLGHSEADTGLCRRPFSVLASTQTAKIPSGPARQLDMSRHPPLRLVVQLGHHVFERVRLVVRTSGPVCKVSTAASLSVPEGSSGVRGSVPAATTCSAPRWTAS
jgi:hypothetical protein